MTQKEFITLLAAEHDLCVEISRKKNQDYATNDDAFLNFRSSSVVGVDIRRAILVRMMDKIVRVSNLLDKNPLVVEESVADTLRDISNYSLILKLLIDDERSKVQSSDASKTAPPPDPNFPDTTGIIEGGVESGNYRLPPITRITDNPAED